MIEEFHKESILCLFPALSEIKDIDLREKTISALKAAIERGGHTEETVRLVPISITYQDVKVTLVEHINDVADLCIQGFEILSMRASRNDVRFDRDLLIAGALLHDIGKFTEYKKMDAGYSLSETGRLMRHPYTGMLIAAECGLPNDLLQIIGTHSFEGDNDPQTAESDFLRRMDMIAFSMSVFNKKKINQFI